MINVGNEIEISGSYRVAGQKAIVLEVDYGNNDTPYGSGGYARYKVAINGEVYPQYIPDIWVKEV